MEELLSLLTVSQSNKDFFSFPDLREILHHGNILNNTAVIVKFAAYSKNEFRNFNFLPDRLDLAREI